MVATRHQDYQYPMATLCHRLELPHSSYSYQRRPANDPAVQAAIEALAAEFHTSGSRRLTAQWRCPPDALVVNRKRVQRLRRALGLQPLMQRRRQSTTDSRHGDPRSPNLVLDLTITAPDQVWGSDISSVRRHLEFVYLVVIMAVFTRSIRGWHLHRWLDQDLTLTALQRVLTTRVPRLHPSDQGVQYAAHADIEWLHHHQIQISMADVGHAWQNGYDERLVRTIKEEEVGLAYYHALADAYRQIGHFIEHVDQYKRIHSALGYLTPVEFEVAWQDHYGEASSLISA